MNKLFRVLLIAVLVLPGVISPARVLALDKDKDDHDAGKKKKLMTWPHQQITHQVIPIGPPHKVNLRSLADSAKAHPRPLKQVYVEQGEDAEEKFKYKPRHAAKGSHVFPVPPVAGEGRLANSPAPIASFNGVLDNNTEIPPDIDGAAGPDYVFETTNQQFDIYDKSGNLVTTLQIPDFFGSSISSTFFYDPHVLYDAAHGRFIACIDDELNNGNSGLGIAVSETNDPTGNWYIYDFNTGIPASTNYFLDYPEMGYNENWVVLTGNNFEQSGVIAEIYVMNRASLYSGSLGTVNSFTDNNAFSWAPAQTYDTTEAVEYMVQDLNGNDAGKGYMQVGSITGTADDPAYDAGYNIGVTSTWSETEIDAGQLGSSELINADDNRVQDGVVYINGTLWFTHEVALPAGNRPTYLGVDWWQIDPGAQTVLQFGRIDDANKNTNYYYPSINVNSNGDALLGYSISGTDSFYPTAAYSFHAAADPANSMESRYIYKSGLGSYYKTLGGTRNRWGDFTGTAVDPNDNSFWTLGQWAQTGNYWGTQIAHVGPSVPLALAPVANFGTGNSSSSCSGLFYFNDLSSNTPTSWLWNFGDGTTSTLQNPSHEYTANGTYTVTLTATNAYGHNSVTFTDYITIDKPAAPQAAGQSSCGPKSFSLSAVTSNHVSWYDSTGGAVSTANPFVTPVLNYTTTYWVEDTVIQPIDSVGPLNTGTLGAGGFFANTDDDQYLIFNAIAPFTLISVVVDAQGAGDRTLALRDAGGNTLQSLDINLAGGLQTVTLNFKVPAGENYELAVNGTSNLYRNNADAGDFYPFTIPGLVSITGSSAGGGYYYNYYNWKVQSIPCISARTAVTATINPTITNLNPSPDEVLCYGGATGSVTLSPSGGTPAFQYSWSNGQTTNPATGLIAGTYKVTVTDAASCTATGSETITQPTLLTVSATPVNASCEVATGSATATPSGGTAGYTYRWSNGGTTSTISNLSPNTYGVTVNDANSCSATASTTVTNSGINLSVTPTSATCFGTATGGATATVTGDANPVTYKWSTGATTVSITNVVAGTYEVTATDNTGCSSSTSQSISQPSQLDVSVSETNSACGTSSGTASAVPSGGTSGYSYHWNNSETTATISNLNGSTYLVTVTDAHSCTSTGSATVSYTGSLNLTATPGSATCFGTASGSATANVTGDINTVSYIWSNTATTASITNINAGNYSVTAFDGTGCSATSSVTVSQPTAVNVSVSETNSTCGTATGTATASPSGGTSGYTYHWSNSATTATIGNLAANTYQVTVDDAHSCTATASAIITYTGSLNLSAVPTPAACFGTATGSAAANVTGDANTVSYIWNTTATTATITNLAPGNYSVTASDGTGCSATSSVNVSQPSAVNVSVSETNTSCGAAIGSATAVPSGGTSGYSYHWSTSATTATITDLMANSYQVTVTDAHSCTATGTATVTSNGSLDLTATPIEVSCYGLSTGGATASVSGDANPVNYIWNNAATTASISNVVAGNYAVTASDNTGCSATASVTVSQPSALDVSVTGTNIACGGTAGAATASPSGGTSGYSYKWSNSATTATISDLTANTYNVTVTDAHSCTVTGSTTIINTGSLDLSVTPTGATCFGASTGSATASVSGDAHTISYTWNNSATTATISNEPAGSYSVTATDGTGCSATSAVTISQPSALDVSVSSTNIACGSTTGGATAIPTGGTPGYSYIWSNAGTTATISDLAANTYYVTVTDAHSCTATGTAIITHSGTLNLVVTPVNVACFGTSTGAATANVIGDANTVSYVWNNAATTATISNLPIGAYSVTASDITGCSATATDTITQPAILSVSAIPVSAGCGQSDGSATASASGGTPAYSFLWSNESTGAAISGLAADNYSVTVTDTNGCTAATTITVGTATSLNANFTINSVSCYNYSNGGATVNVTSGTAPFDYAWNNGATTASISDVPAGYYMVTITDASGCRKVDTLDIAQPTEIVVLINDVPPTCAGVNNGSANAQVSGGHPSYTFKWSNSSTTDTILNLVAGTYKVTVSDISGCSVSSSATLNATSTITTQVFATADSCYGTQIASANLVPTGGAGPYTYVWNTGLTSDSATGLAAGNYTVTITDTHSCSATIGVNITQADPIKATVSSSPATIGQNDGSASIDSVSGGNPPYSYKWSGGQTTLSVTNLYAGTYTVTISDQSQCEQTDTVTVKIVTGIISTGNTLNFNIYPNPAKNEITVEFNLTGTPTSLILRDVLGQTIFSTRVAAPKTMIDLSGYSDGVYFIELNQGDNRAVQQVIVSR